MNNYNSYNSCNSCNLSYNILNNNLCVFCNIIDNYYDNNKYIYSFIVGVSSLTQQDIIIKTREFTIKNNRIPLPSKLIIIVKL